MKVRRRIPTGPNYSRKPMLTDEVETIWFAIAERDDWTLLYANLAALKRVGEARGDRRCRRGTSYGA